MEGSEIRLNNTVHTDSPKKSWLRIAVIIVCTGCGVLPWHQSPVSMVCFSTGRRRDQRPDMFLFVVGSSDVRNAPAAGETKFAPVNSLYTASWTADGRTYVLAIEGDEASLRRYL